MQKVLEYERHAAACRQIAAETKNSQYKKQLHYLYGPAVCCKPDVSDGGIGVALLYPARE